MRSVVLFATFLFAGALSAASSSVEHSFESAVQRGGIKRIVIDIPTGNVTVRNGSAERVALAGIVTRDYDSAKEREWAQRVVNDTSVEIYVSGEEALVRRKFGRNARSWRARKFSDFDIRLDLPAGVDVKFHTSAGQIDVAGSFGNIDANLRAGTVNVRVPRSSVRELTASCRLGEVRTNLGTEVVTKEGVLPGRTKFFNPSGRSFLNLHVTTGAVDVMLTE